MAAPAATEITVICVDTSFRVHRDSPFLKAQIEAIKQYCVVKFQCNPDNQVGIFIMSDCSYRIGYLMITPTSDLAKILRSLKGILDKCAVGRVNFPCAVQDIAVIFRWTPPHIKRRVLAFVGSPINLYSGEVLSLGSLLKERSMALDVVYFLLSGKDVDQTILSYDNDQCAREELSELIAIVNDKDNSQMVDAYVGESSVWDILSKSILKKNIRYLRKKDEKKQKRNVNVKQELELTFVNCNDTDMSRMIDSFCNKVLQSIPKNHILAWEELQKSRNLIGLKGFQKSKNAIQPLKGLQKSKNETS